MRAFVPVYLVAVMAVSFRFVAPATASESLALRGTFERLDPVMARAARLGGVTPLLAADLEAARRESLIHTIRHRAHPGDYRQWALPFIAIQRWNIQYAIDDHADAHRALEAILTVLRGLRGDEAATQGVIAATRILDAYLWRWRESHAFEAVEALGKFEEWVLAPATRTLAELRFEVEIGGRRIEKKLKRTDGLNVWVNAMRRHQAEFLRNEHWFAPDLRGWLRDSRDEWFRRLITREDLPAELRDELVADWARALYDSGRTERAEEALLAWFRRRGVSGTAPRCRAMLVNLVLFGYGDWERATALRAAFNARAETFRRPQDRRNNAGMHRLYYQCLPLPDYELRRLRAALLAERADRIAAADEHRLRKAIEEPLP